MQNVLTFFRIETLSKQKDYLQAKSIKDGSSFTQILNPTEDEETLVRLFAMLMLRINFHLIICKLCYLLLQLHLSRRRQIYRKNSCKKSWKYE